VSYAHEDSELQKQLNKHLEVLRKENIIDTWDDGQIVPGSVWNEDIARQLAIADLILLLVSSDFLNSTYCYKKEMTSAIERHKTGTARVIPIILKSCAWELAPFAKLQGLPKGMKPVTEWPQERRDAVWIEVAKGIYLAAQAWVDSAANTAALSTEVFPRGLRLLEFEPGELFVVKSVDRNVLLSWWSLARLGLALLVVLGFFGPAAFESTVPALRILIFVLCSVLVLTYWYFNERLGKRVTLDLHRLRSWVSDPPGFSGGHWPPNIGHVTHYDNALNMYITTVYIDGVPIMRRKDETRSGGIEQLTPFITALKRLTAKRRPRADTSASKIEGSSL
jgi:hypothetical protein